MTAQFKADSTFIIRGRGLVLSGWVIEGVVRAGMRISIETFPRMLTIDGIELITTIPRVPGLFGLLFLSTDPQEIALWKSLEVKDLLFDVLEPDS